MNIASHEAYDLHELTLSCVNSITNMSLFLGQVQDQELKSILERHYPLHIKDYNMKVQYIQTLNSTSTLQIPELNEAYVNQTPNEVKPVVPRTNIQTLNDREIATAYLLTLKRAGREYAWAAMESSNPEIRKFLESAFQMSSHHAFEVYNWMVKQGYYPYEHASPQTLQSFGNTYQILNQPQ